MTRHEVTAIMSQMYRNDHLTQVAIQQVSNGFYRGVELLVLLTADLDKESAYTCEIREAESIWHSQENLCHSAQQQAANGVYRTVELLNILVKLLDKKQARRIEAASIMQAMTCDENFCQNAPQQMANGANRMSEMLCIIAQLLTADRTSQLHQLMSEMHRIDNLCQDVSQQTANAVDTAATIMEMLVRQLDNGKKYSSQLSSIISLKQRNNALCRNADAQTANRLYRIMEMAQIITNIIVDEKERRIEAYWEAHAEEKEALLQEKIAQQQKLLKIEREAAAMTSNAELSRLRAEKAALESSILQIGISEMTELREKVYAATRKRDAISFFQFSQRKAAQKRIEAAQLEMDKKQAEIDARKAEICIEIDAKQQQIESINTQLGSERAAILKQKAPYEARIRSIDAELTRER